MVYANPLLIVQAMSFASKGQSVYYSTQGWFLKIFKCIFAVNVTIKIHYSFIVWRIKFSQEDVLLQSFTEQYFIVNKLSKIQDTRPPHTLVLRKRTAYLFFVLYE